MRIAQPILSSKSLKSFNGIGLVDTSAKSLKQSFRRQVRFRSTCCDSAVRCSYLRYFCVNLMDFPGLQRFNHRR